MRPIRKLQVGRILMKILAEQFTKQAARHDESIPIVRKMKSIRPSFLLERKRRLQFAGNLTFAVQRRVPHVDFIPDLFPFR